MFVIVAVKIAKRRMSYHARPMCSGLNYYWETCSIAKCSDIAVGAANQALRGTAELQEQNIRVTAVMTDNAAKGISCLEAIVGELPHFRLAVKHESYTAAMKLVRDAEVAEELRDVIQCRLIIVNAVYRLNYSVVTPTAIRYAMQDADRHHRHT